MVKNYDVDFIKGVYRRNMDVLNTVKTDEEPTPKLMLFLPEW